MMMYLVLDSFMTIQSSFHFTLPGSGGLASAMVWGLGEVDSLLKHLPGRRCGDGDVECPHDRGVQGVASNITTPLWMPNMGSTPYPPLNCSPSSWPGSASGWS